MSLARVRARLSPLGRRRSDSIVGSDIDSSLSPDHKRDILFYKLLSFVADMTHPLSCSCGALTGSVQNERLANHSICYCKDCQSFARFLGRDAELLDARG